MRPLIDIINTDNQINILDMKQKAIQQIDPTEWIYKGCFISKQRHPLLFGNYCVFKNDKDQTHVGRCLTFKEAKALCEQNECNENHLQF